MPWSGIGSRVVPSTASAKWSWSAAGVSAAAAALTPATSVPVTIQVGTDVLVGGGGDQPGSAAERPDDLPAGVEQLERSAGRPGELRVDAAGPGAVGDELGGDLAADLGPGPNDDAERVRARAGPEQLGRGRHVGGVERGGHLLAGGADIGRALDRDRIALAADPVDERFRERADDGRDRVGGTPVVEVPPDVIAGVDGGRGRPLRRLDAVDVIEPVRLGATGPDPADRVNEAAPVARRDACRSARASASPSRSPGPGFGSGP